MLYLIFNVVLMPEQVSCFCSILSRPILHAAVLESKLQTVQGKKHCRRCQSPSQALQGLQAFSTPSLTSRHPDLRFAHAVASAGKLSPTLALGWLPLLSNNISSSVILSLRCLLLPPRFYPTNPSFFFLFILCLIGSYHNLWFFLFLSLLELSPPVSLEHMLMKAVLSLFITVYLA